MFARGIGVLAEEGMVNPCYFVSQKPILAHHSNSGNMNMADKSIHKFDQSGGWRSSKDQIACEAPLQLSIRQGEGQRQVAITMRTPGMDVELSLGFLLTEGILSPDLDPNDWPIFHADKEKNHLVLELPDSITIDWKHLSRQTYTSSSCGVCGKTSIDQVFTKVPWPEPLNDFQIAPELVTTLPDRLRAAQPLFAKTGANHGCALFDLAGELLEIAEDVGRHNALDKLLGKFWMSKIIPCEYFILVLSGRASFELIQKAAMAGIRFVIAVGAPSTLAVELAKEMNMTLCGFVKAKGFNVYAGVHRLAKSPAG